MIIFIKIGHGDDDGDNGHLETWIGILELRTSLTIGDRTPLLQVGHWATS